MKPSGRPSRMLLILALGGLVMLAGAGPASATVYVSNTEFTTVSVIDTATNAVVTSIAVGSEPRNLAATPGGSRVYVPNRFDDNVSVISTQSNTAIATVNHASFDEPYAVAITPNGSEAWVAKKKGGGSSTGSVTIIATLTNTVSGVINDVCFNSPEGILINPVLARAYVVNRGNGTVCVVETGTRNVIATTVGGEPRHAVATPDGAAIFVARPSGDDVARINTANNAATSIPIASGDPRNMAITPSGDKIYVPTQLSSVAVILTSNNSVSTISLSVNACS